MPHWVRWLWLTIALLGVCYMAWRLLSLLLMLAIALLLTAALVPVVKWLDARKVPHGLSVALCFLGMIGVLVGLVSFAGPLVADQARQLSTNLSGLSARYDWVERHWGTWRQQYGMLPEFAELSEMIAARVQASAGVLIGLGGQFVTMAIGTFSVMFVAFFFLKDGHTLSNQLLALIPAPQRDDAREVLGRITERVGLYVLGLLLNMMLVGTLTGIGLALLGVPYAVVLGLLIGLLDIIPFLGPFLGALPGVIVAFSVSPLLGLWTIGLYAGVQQLEGFLTYPTVVGRAVKLHPAWIFLSLLAGGELLGIAGMVLAVPTMVVVQIVLEEWYLPWVHRHRRTPALATPDDPATIRFTRPAWGEVVPKPEPPKHPPRSD